MNRNDFEERQKSKCWPNEIHILSLFNSPFTVLARPYWAVSQDGYFIVYEYYTAMQRFVGLQIFTILFL
jgi:hypothetical protein